jgi:hypothetical protein
MIAAAIIAVIMAIVYGSFAGTVRTVRIGEAEGEAYRKASIILNRMIVEINCAFMPPEPELADVPYGFFGEDREEDGVPRDSLYFTSTGVPLGGRPIGPKEIGFSIAADPETGMPVFLLREDTTPDEDLAEGGVTYPLGQGVWGLDVTYYDATGKKWERWESASPVFGGNLPRLVKISLILKNSMGEFVSVETQSHVQQTME